MRLVYFGTPDDAVAPLRALHDAGHEIALVVTQPDRRRGRGGATAPSPVRAAAEALGLDVRTPTRARELTAEIAALAPDAGVVVAFGQLLPADLLGVARLGFVNLHFSLLPRWRGAAPVERALLAGDAETGVCVMALDEGLDTGPVYARVATPIGPDDDAGALRARLVALGTPLLIETLADLDGRTPEPQAGEPTHAAKLTVEEFRIDWSAPAAVIDRQVRAGSPRPGAWCECDGTRLKVHRLAPAADGPLGAGVDDPGTVVGGAGGVRVRAGDGWCTLLEVQPAGRAAMAGGAWLAGRQGAPTRLR